MFLALIATPILRTPCASPTPRILQQCVFGKTRQARIKMLRLEMAVARRAEDTCWYTWPTDRGASFVASPPAHLDLTIPRRRLYSTTTVPAAILCVMTNNMVYSSLAVVSSASSRTTPRTRCALAPKVR